MVYYDGNRVAYGSGGSWNVAVDVWDSGPTTAGTVTVFYSYNVYFSTSISDSSNTINWSDPWGSGSANNTAFSGGAGMRMVSGVHQQTWSINYGTTTPIYFRMYATGMAGGGTGPSVVEFAHHLPARLPVPPGATNTAVSGVTANSVNISASWNDTGGAAIDAVMYGLRHGQTGATVGTDQQGGWGGVTYTGLTRGQLYHAYSRGHNSAGWGPWSTPVSFTTSSFVPSAPATPTVTAITQTTASVNWAIPDNGGSALSGFHLQVDDASGFSSPLLDTTESAGNTTRAVSGLTLNTTYYTRVRTWNKNGYSGWSPTRSFLTAAGPPNAPGGMGAVNVKQDSATIAFAAAVTNGTPVTQYRVMVAEQQNFAAAYWDAIVPSGDRSDDVPGLIPNTLYYARVAANSAAGWGPWSAVISFRTVAGLFVSVGGVAKAAQLYVSVGGVPKPADVYLSVGGTPRLI